MRKVAKGMRARPMGRRGKAGGVQNALSLEAQKKLLDRLLREGIKPHVDTLAEIAFAGGVAVVVFEPGPLASQAARTMGWDGHGSVFRLPLAQYPALARHDPVTARWLAREGEELSRMLVLWHDGSLLVNFKPDDGYWIEPGSTNNSGRNSIDPGES